MYTENKRPGKFEYCESEYTGKALYNASIEADNQINFSNCYVDAYMLVKGIKHWFICHESEQGFFTYETYTPEAGSSTWEGLESEYNGYN